jgi:hypothetical protein
MGRYDSIECCGAEDGMRATRWVVLLGVLTPVAFVIAQASAAGPPATSVQCSWHAHITSEGYRYKGALVGAVRCSHRFGRGAYHGRYRDNIREPTTASETGSSKLSFKAGTVRGTYMLGPATISGTARYQGKFHITDGTGRFTHVSGTLHMSCAHRVPPTVACTVSGPVTGI